MLILTIELGLGLTRGARLMFVTCLIIAWSSSGVWSSSAGTNSLEVWNTIGYPNVLEDLNSLSILKVQCIDISSSQTNLRL